MRDLINLVEYSQISGLHSVKPVHVLRYAMDKDAGDVHQALLAHMRANNADGADEIEAWLKTCIDEAVQHIMRNLRSQIFKGIHGAPQSPLGVVWTTSEAEAQYAATNEGVIITTEVNRSIIDWTATLAHRIFLDRGRGAFIVLNKGSMIKDVSGHEWTI